MKHIKGIIFYLMVFFACLCGAQTHSEFISDKQVAFLKTAITLLLKKEHSLLKKQNNIIKQIKIEEDIYQGKIGPFANISNSIVFIGVQTTLENLEKKISKIEHNIKVRKIATLGIRHGLSRFESELKRQKKYFLKLKSENEVITYYALGSGGAGHNYTSYLKLLLRIIKVRSKIFKIDKEVKNLMTVSALFSK